MIVADSTKQKVNARILTESELIGVDDIISKILWNRRFLECQGFKVKANIIYQDNTSTKKKNCKRIVEQAQGREHDIMILSIFMS